MKRHSVAVQGQSLLVHPIIIPFMAAHLRQGTVAVAQHTARVMQASVECPDLNAGKAAEDLASIGIVECMAFSSDGRFLGVSTADGVLTIYDWHSGRPLNVIRFVLCTDSMLYG